MLKMVTFTRAGWLLSALFFAPGAFPANYDPETMTISAASLLPPEVLQGEHYKVADDVTVSGYMNHYTVDSDYGVFTAVGNRKLKMLLHEIDAIAELKTMTSTGVGADAVVGTVTDTGKSVVTLVTNPVESAQNIGAGVSRLFKRTAKTSKDVSQQVSDEVRDEEGDADAGEPAGEEHAEEEDSTQSDLGSQVAKAYLGIGKAHREIARELAVDPYSDNPVLQEELARVAQISGTVGKLTRLAMPIPALVGTASSVSNMVWSLSPTDLLIQNEETLEALGYDKELIEQFFSNENYTPTKQTILVAAIKSLDGVKGREIWLHNAIMMKSAIEGDFMVRSVLFAQIYHENIEPMKEFIASPTGYIPIVIAGSGKGIVFAPLDQLLWTEEVDKEAAEMARLMDEHGGGKEHLLWVDGRASASMLSGLQSTGWEVTQAAFTWLEQASEEQTQ